MHLVSEPGTREGQHVIRVTGPVTLESVTTLREAVRAVTVPKLIIDLTEVPYVDSSAVGAFVHAYVAFRDSKRKLAIVGMTQRVKTVFHLASLDVLFALYPTLAEAEQALA